MKKRLLVAALAACMAFPASLPAQAAGTVHGKKVGWIQEKGQTYYCDPSTLQNVRGKWQLIGKNYYYFDQLGRLVRNKWVGNYHVGDNGALEKNKWIGKYLSVKTESGSRNSRAAGIRSTKSGIIIQKKA